MIEKSGIISKNFWKKTFMNRESTMINYYKNILNLMFNELKS